MGEDVSETPAISIDDYTLTVEEFSYLELTITSNLSIDTESTSPSARLAKRVWKCDIPVVIMGETGCGKTRLIKFMCDLWKPPGIEDMQNMVLVKVHGGTTEQDIMRKVTQASKLAQENKKKFEHLDTVLFFDEANATEAIGLIKEIICDKRMKGQPLPFTEGLKIIAACNPYRKHSDKMIERLEQAGLGYRVQARHTKDKLGYIPMRQLVYRVQALPQSILPLVWDFGQLSAEVEYLYIKQMVHRCIKDDSLPHVQGLHKVASDVLATSQQFMRKQKEECSFVSLRDVKRVLDVMSWFYKKRQLLFRLMDERAKKEIENYVSDDKDNPVYERLDDVTRSLVLALGVCYHACLQNREGYRKCIARHFTGTFQLPSGARTIYDEINRCEDVFLDNVQLEPNIARNQALKENIFMMIICIELRIPLFLVGKPGSSKSLARTIVAGAMQGKMAHSMLFQQFKEVYMISFQCSPISTADGIMGIFRQCSQLQKKKDLSEFVAAVVLDEVGLAEDSPSMPLKALHPLLEDGCVGDEDAEPYKKVAFIGISNWALDPAKMNRGILVQRGIPDDRELVRTASEITTEKLVQRKISPYVLPLAEAYLELYNSALENREFFGLRDFYRYE
ncbi:hypothetical protein LSAT2_030557 [Lamellibrachia satsuma]|nr:hypothetical protein LSAT2_030557 [Lamellibrachia satsuma]